ncbi:hypothetical protein [Chryseobacterium sp.]|uniref:hypothetical protein n=1 Tax=Chryseobacterium sp. TaxID=1871047 RepID=UPI003218E5AD
MENQKFQIKINEPKYILPRGGGHNLMSIFSTCFEFPKNDFDVVFNDMTIGFSYKYEVPYIIYPILEMLNSICSSNSGKCKAYIGVEEILSEWNLQWETENLRLQINWERTSNDFLEQLNEIEELNINLNHFVSEWYKLIHLIDRIIKESNIQIDDLYYIGDFQNVKKKILKKIESKKTKDD